MEEHDNNPLVSVIVPAYNRESTLRRAINSVIKQTYQNWHLVIVDDRSTDGTRDLVNHYIKNEKRIKYLYNQCTKGVSGARNFGILNSIGKYIAFLDSDDEWVSHHLEKSIGVLEKYDMTICFSLLIEEKSGIFYRVFDLPNEANKLTKAVQDLKPEIIDDLIFFDKKFYEYSVVHSLYCYNICTMVFNRLILDTIGLFNEEFAGSEDIDFTTRSLFHYEFCLIKDYHFIYHQGNEDNLFFFIDRRNADLTKIANDQAIIDKFNNCGFYHVKFRKNRIKMIQASNQNNINKKACIKAYHHQI